MTTATPIRWTDAEAAALTPEVDEAIDDWAETHRFVAEGPAIGNWNNATFPPVVAIMVAVVSRSWSKVVVTGPPQKAKTEGSILNPLLYCLFKLMIDVALVMPSGESCKKAWEKKIRPAIDQSDSLNKYLLDREEGGSRVLRHFGSSTSLHLVGADSSGALSSFTVPAVFCDEVDDYQSDVGGKGHPADQAAKRVGAFPPDQRIIVETCTVTTHDGRVWVGFLEGTQSLYMVPCIGCGTYQVLTRAANPPREAPATTLVFDPECRTHGPQDVWMRCSDPECEHHIVKSELPAMLARGAWVAKGQTVEGRKRRVDSAVVSGDLPDTRIASYWYSAWYWPFEEWWELANSFAVSRGDPDREKEYQIHVDVLPFKAPEIDEDALTVEELQAHATEGYEAKTVPAEADLVTVTVDVQSGYVYYIVRAWNKSDGTSWLVDLGTFGRPIRGRDESKGERLHRRVLGITNSLDLVDAMTLDGWPIAGSDVRLGMACGLIDRGFERDTVAGWHLVHHRDRWHTIIGDRGKGKASLWPDKPKRDNRRRIYRAIDVNQGQTLLRRLLRIPAERPGHWHMPSSGLHANTVRAYFRHMVSTRFNQALQTPRWEKITPGAANHFWDCEVYQISAAIAAGVKLAGAQEPEPVVMTDWFARQKKRGQR